MKELQKWADQLATTEDWWDRRYAASEIRSLANNWNDITPIQGLLIEKLNDKDQSVRVDCFMALKYATGQGYEIDMEKVLEKLRKIPKQDDMSEHAIRKERVGHYTEFLYVMGKRERIQGILSNGKPKAPNGRNRLVRVRRAYV